MRSLETWARPTWLTKARRRKAHKSLFGASIGRGAGRIINAMVQGLSRMSINPNLLTVIGVSINVLCGLMFAFGHFFWAGSSSSSPMSSTCSTARSRV